MGRRIMEGGGAGGEGEGEGRGGRGQRGGKMKGKMKIRPKDGFQIYLTARRNYRTCSLSAHIRLSSTKAQGASGLLGTATPAGYCSASRTTSTLAPGRCHHHRTVHNPS